MDYSQEIKNSTENNIIPNEDIYDFVGSDFEELLTNYHKFCRDNLDIQSKQEKISPNIFVFTNSFEVNAGAGLINKHFVITINLGLFRSCVDNYYTNTNLAIYFQSLYPDTIKRYDNPINILAFQICTQFTYYHELAHLFQFSDEHCTFKIQERNDKDENDSYDRTKHILEINADTYASIAVTTHIEQYISRTFKEEVTIENTLQTFIFFGCCLLNYTLNFSENAEEIYFEKHTHPHSFIRQLNTVLNMVNHVEQSPYFKNKKISINSGELFKTIIAVYKDLEANGVFGTNVTKIIDEKKDLSKPMAEYLFSLIQFDIKDYRNAMDIWNKHIT